MKLITKQTDYAIRAVMTLAGTGDRRTPTREIATKERLPLPYLRRILQVLIKNGIVTSKEGVTGGVKLAHRPAEIQLIDLIEMFQGSIQLSECMFRKKLCHNRSTCVLRKRIQEIERRVTREFEDITIADLLRDLEEGNETTDNSHR
jgi:Rrf2 family protein